jgi:hypothetical protein
VALATQSSEANLMLQKSVVLLLLLNGSRGLLTVAAHSVVEWPVDNFLLETQLVTARPGIPALHYCAQIAVGHFAASPYICQPQLLIYGIGASWHYFRFATRLKFASTLHSS